MGRRWGASDHWQSVYIARDREQGGLSNQCTPVILSWHLHHCIGFGTLEPPQASTLDLIHYLRSRLTLLGHVLVRRRLSESA